MLGFILPGDHGGLTSLVTGHIFVQISPVGLFSELSDVCHAVSSSAAVYQTTKYYSILATCPQQRKLVVFPKFISKSFVWDQKTFSQRNNCINSVFHKCLVEPGCTWNATLTVLFPPAVIYPASLGKDILRSNLGCLKLTSPSAWQPLL